MKPALVVTIPGDPVGAARPRFSRGKPPTRASLEVLSREELIQKLLNPGFVHTHKTTKHKDWEALATAQALRAMRSARVLAFSAERKPLDGPVGVSMLSIHPRPGRLRRKMDTRERVPFLGVPDVDNVAKLAFDAFTKAGVWSDDARVFRLRAESWYVAIGAHVVGGKAPDAEAPRVIVAVYDLEGVVWAETRAAAPTLEEIAAFVESTAPPGLSVSQMAILQVAEAIRQWRPGA